LQKGFIIKVNELYKIDENNTGNTYVAPPAMRAISALCGVTASTMACNALSESSLINPLLSPFFANKPLTTMSRSYKGTKVVFFSDDLDILCSFRIKI
jgi:hypothetical protein